MPAGFDILQIVYYLTAAGGLAAVLSFAIPIIRRRKRANRIQSVVSRYRGDLGRQQMEGLSAAQRQRRPKGKVYVELAQALVERLRLEGMVSQQKVRNFLAQGGFRARSALAAYFVARLIGIGAGIVASISLVAMLRLDYPFMVEVLLWALGGVVGFYGPKIFITNLAQKRQKEMGQAFPDALDLLVICVEAGLSIEAAFERVTREIAESAPTLAQELGLCSAELAFLGDRSKAYQNFADRTGLPAVRSLATALIQTERYGTPVSVAVKVLASEKRQERMSAAEKKAAALPAQLTVPMIIFFLPVLFIVVIGPAIIQIVNR